MTIVNYDTPSPLPFVLLYWLFCQIARDWGREGSRYAFFFSLNKKINSIDGLSSDKQVLEQV